MHRRRLTPAARILFVAVSLLLASAVAAPASAASKVVERTFKGVLGSGALYGTAFITAYTSGDALSDLAIQNLSPNSTYTIRIYDGGCSTVGKTALTLPMLRTDGSGSVARSQAISVRNMNAVWKYALNGPVAIRVFKGTTTLCAALSYPVATRVIVDGYPIDLPVIRPPGGDGAFPRCNVAMYFEALSQPGEPGVSFLFAHARTGMFLPLLHASQKANGKAMLGKTIWVYTSDSKLYSYRIIQVRRHLHSIMSAFDSWTTNLWLQTSEGPNASYPKLVIVAAPIAVETVSYAESHPKPHPKVCH
jgi:hypothetical protein